MSIDNATIPEWHAMQTDETRSVAELLRQHFESADAYRYNSAAIRVRVVDPTFKNISRECRDDLVEPFLDTLPEEIQGDILNLVLLYPDEEKVSVRAMFSNWEFEHPSESML
jgi:hypothetical protein